MPKDTRPDYASNYDSNNKDVLMQELKQLQAELATQTDPGRIDYIQKRIQELKMQIFQMGIGARKNTGAT